MKVSISQLVFFMRQHGYEYIRCHDSSVCYNVENLKFSTLNNRNDGPCIRSVKRRALDLRTRKVIDWKSKVFCRQKSFIKIETPWLIENEKRILSKIHYPYVPKIINSGRYGN